MFRRRRAIVHHQTGPRKRKVAGPTARRECPASGETWQPSSFIPSRYKRSLHYFSTTNRSSATEAIRMTRGVSEGSRRRRRRSSLSSHVPCVSIGRDRWDRSRPRPGCHQASARTTFGRGKAEARRPLAEIPSPRPSLPRANVPSTGAESFRCLALSSRRSPALVYDLARPLRGPCRVAIIRAACWG